MLNLGVSGNGVLTGVVGPNALSRFDRDVIGIPGVCTFFNIFRDQQLQNSLPLDVISFYQKTLVSGTPYQFEVVAVDSNGITIENLGGVSIASKD